MFSTNRTIYIAIIPIILISLVSCTKNDFSFLPLNEQWIVDETEATRWSMVKHNNLPTLTGSIEWKNYMNFLENEFKKYGVIDIYRNAWEFDKWTISEEPTNWTLSVDGNDVRVAYYGAYSGKTDLDGITAEMIYYDHDNPPSDIKDKIVVIPTRKHPSKPYSTNYLTNFTYNEYEYVLDGDTLPEPFEFVDPEVSFTFDIWYQLAQRLDQIPEDGEAAGAVIVYDMAYDRTKGLYTFPVPDHYDSPTLILSREDGAGVIEASKEKKEATIVLNSKIEKSEAYQLIGYLPGKDYGTDKDEQIILTNHTDGPSITQDNGALGILGIIKYFSNIPQEKRDRTLLIYLDCRHYMPGMEQAHKDVSWLKKNPNLKDKVVGLIQAEHLGEMDYKEVNGEVIPTGYSEQSYLWTRNNDYLIESAKNALDRYGWSRGMLSVPERPGPNGNIQQVWWGVGIIALANELRDNEDCDEYSCDENLTSNSPLVWNGSSCEVWTCLNVPAYGQGGFLGYYWNKYSDISKWSSELFIQQTSTMIDLTGVLMYSDLEKIKPILGDQSFRNTDMSIAAPIDIEE